MSRRAIDRMVERRIAEAQRRGEPVKVEKIEREERDRARRVEQQNPHLSAPNGGERK